MPKILSNNFNEFYWEEFVLSDEKNYQEIYNIFSPYVGFLFHRPSVKFSFQKEKKKSFPNSNEKKKLFLTSNYSIVVVVIVLLFRNQKIAPFCVRHKPEKLMNTSIVYVQGPP